MEYEVCGTGVKVAGCGADHVHYQLWVGVCVRAEDERGNELNVSCFWEVELAVLEILMRLSWTD